MRAHTRRNMSKFSHKTIVDSDIQSKFLQSFFMAPSKRNSSRAVFTSHERNIARAAWSSTSARLTRDSFLPFGSCILCMEPARDPVCCTEGDLMCRECALANVLAQKKEIKRAVKAQERARDGLEKIEKEKEERQKLEDIKKWERVQAGLDNGRPETSHDAETHMKPDKQVQLLLEGSEDANGGKLLLENGNSRGIKRKLTAEQSVDSYIARSARQEVVKVPESSFWTPSLTPSANPLATVASATIKSVPLCPGPGSSGSEHMITAKHLVSLKFTGPNGAPWDQDKESEIDRHNKPRWHCPSCIKALTNASGGVVAKCGHVCCKSCAEMMTEEETPTCFVCSEPDNKGKVYPASWTELRSEGTGFSARGGNKVNKLVTTFNV